MRWFSPAKKGRGWSTKSKRNARVCPAGTQSSCARAATRKVRVRPLAPRARFAAHLPRVRAVAGSQRRLVGHHGNLGLGRDGRRGRRSDARDHRERGQHHGRASHGSLGEVGLCHPEQVSHLLVLLLFFFRWLVSPRPPDRVWDSYPLNASCTLKRRHTDRALEGVTHPASGSGCWSSAVSQAVTKGLHAWALGWASP